MVHHLISSYDMKERKACRLMNLAISSKRYCRKARSSDDNVKEQLIALAHKHIRYGYRRLNACLKQVGFKINHKKTYRLYKEADLKYARQKSRKMKHIKMPPLNVAIGLNQTWSMDFVSDSLTDRRTIRCLNIVDNYSRFNVAIEVAFSLSALQVIHVLDQAMSRYGPPKSIIVDNGPEFRSKALCEWACQHSIILRFIDPGKPTQNAYIESFNGKFRDECLNQYWFSSCQEAKTVIAKWRDDYNNHRPHSSLKYLSPQAFIDQIANNACQIQTGILS